MKSANDVAAEVLSASTGVKITGRVFGARYVEAYAKAVREAAMEEARLLSCEFREPCDGEIKEMGRLDGWCSYCTIIRERIRHPEKGAGGDSTKGAK